jgi:hypothetical protein
MPRSTRRAELAKPALDLVQPGRICRCEMELDIGMLLKRVLDQIRFMRGEVVQDNVYIPIHGLRATTSSRNATNSGAVCRGAV